MHKILSFLYKNIGPILVGATCAAIVVVPAFFKIDGGHLALHLNGAEAGLSDYTFSGLMRSFVSWIGLLIISFGALVLTLAGALFDVLMDWTIINFAGHMGNVDTGCTTGCLNIMNGKDGAIEIIWTAFRDISNIIIIAMFII